jgi:hypothetical protein
MNSKPVEAAVLRRQYHPIIINLSSGYGDYGYAEQAVADCRQEVSPLFGDECRIIQSRRLGATTVYRKGGSGISFVGMQCRWRSCQLARLRISSVECSVVYCCSLVGYLVSQNTVSIDDPRGRNVPLFSS